MKKILLGLTTTLKSNWKEKIEEIKKFNLEEIALFPTFLEIKDREKLYSLLEKTPIKAIPHVHLKDDMENWEVEYFFKKYNTRLFNIHSTSKCSSLLEKIQKYLKNIFVENGTKIDSTFLNILKKTGGICFDVAHFQDFGILQKSHDYSGFSELLKTRPIGCCHISAVMEEAKNEYNWLLKKEIKSFSCHSMQDLDELEYVKQYISYLPDIISIELENSFEEQLKAKEYLEEIINRE